MALLTLLFARPYLKRPDAVAGADTEAVILVDASGSMAGGALGVRNIDLALEAARRVARDLGASTKVTVAAFADSVREIPDLNRAALPAAGATDYRRALQWARDRLALSPCARRRVFLVTDLQAAGLPDKPVPDWPLAMGVTVVPVAPAGPWNAGIGAVRNLTPYLGTGNQGMLAVDLAAFGDIPGDPVDVTVEIRGCPPQQIRVPLRTGTTEVPWTPPKPGSYRGVVKLSTNDACPGDNQRHFVVTARRPHPVLLVNGTPGKTAYEDATYFLDKALTVPPREGAFAAFTTETRPQLGMINHELVALCNVASLGTSDLQRLAAYVRDGGGLFCFLGDQTTSWFSANLARLNLFPGKLTVSSVAVPRQVLEWDASHPALALFKSRESGDLARIIFRDAFRIEPAPTARVLARLGNGTPAILSMSSGQGRVVVVANPCDRQWSNWPAERVFLPLMQELCSFLVGGRSEVETPIEKAGGMDETRSPGVYVGAPPVIVNWPPSESDVRTATEPAFRAALGIGPTPAATPAPGVPPDRLPPKRAREHELWLALASALLAIMFLENALADRGHA